MGTVFSDVRFAVRSLARRPMFAGTAIATLALGIGANASIFTVTNGMLYAPFPYEEPEELVALNEANPSLGWDGVDVNPANVWDWRERSRSMEDMAVYYGDALNFTGDGDPELVQGLRATSNVFTLLGREPAMGRGFQADEMGEGRDDAAVLTHGFWVRRFGGDPTTLGRTLVLDGESYTVVGILPEDFVFFGERPDLFLPFPMHPSETLRDSRFAESVGRLAEGATLEDARTELTQIAGLVAQEHPDTNEGWTVEATSMRQEMLGGIAERAAQVLMGAVAFILLMACVNVAGLLMARGEARFREMAVRSALGAGRARVLRQLMTESLVLALAGGALGMMIGVWGSRVITAGMPSDMPPVFRYEVDGTVLLFVALVTLGAAVAFGLSPALHLLRSGGDALRGGGRHGGARRSGRFGGTLVVAQTGLAVVLLVGGGLLMKSLAGMRDQDFGFDPESVLTLRVTPPESTYPEAEDLAAFWAAAEARVQDIQSVHAIGSTQSHPLMGSNWGSTIRLASEPERDLTVRTTYATGGYFEALGVQAVRGRIITDEDAGEAPFVAVVNETFVRRYMGEEIDPLSQTLLVESQGETGIPIVGVIPDMIERGIDRGPEPNWYIHPEKGGIRSRSLVMKTAAPTAQVLAQVQEAIWSIDANLPLYRVETMEDVVERRLGGFLLIAQLMGAFALLSLILGAVGIYGVTAFSAGQRSQEIGLRKALGAEDGQVVSMVVHSGALKAGLGLVLGLGAALGMAKLLTSILVDVNPWDPTVFGLVTGALAAVSFLGLWVPARRAARVDPVQALSAE